jgi:outer membrane protein OmpA-like peptidoglycan-associated protein
MPHVRLRVLLGSTLLVLGPALQAQQQVQMIVTAVPNPVPAGSCAGILVEVRDPSGQRLANVDGIQLYPNSYDYSVPNVTDFSWRNGDPNSGYLCSRAGADAVSTPVIATIRGTGHFGSTVLAIQPGPAAQVATATPPAAAPTPAAAYAQGAPAGTSAPGQPYVSPTPPPLQPDPAAAPTSYAQPGTTAGAPVAAPAGQPSAQPAAGGQPGVTAAVPPGYAPPQTGYQQGTAPTQPTPAVGYQPPAPAPQPTPAPVPVPEKGVGGFFKKLGKHIKDRAGEVTTATANNVATSATRLVDTTLQTGSGLVSGTVAGASNMAQVTVGGAGKSLLPSALRMDGSSDNLSLAINSGRAVLREMRFDPASGQLTPASLELAHRVANELRGKPAKWVIEAYVDPAPGDQQLSEYRAGLVKAVLMHFGVPGESLMALGYGPSKLEPLAPADGGAPTAAHIDIAQRAE